MACWSCDNIAGLAIMAGWVPMICPAVFVTSVGWDDNRICVCPAPSICDWLTIDERLTAPGLAWLTTVGELIGWLDITPEYIILLLGLVFIYSLCYII